MSTAIWFFLAFSIKISALQQVNIRIDDKDKVATETIREFLVVYVNTQPLDSGQYTVDPNYFEKNKIKFYGDVNRNTKTEIEISSINSTVSSLPFPQPVLA